MSSRQPKCLSGLLCDREQCRPDECSASSKREAKNVPGIIFGLIVVTLGLWGLDAWWWSVVELIRGILPLALILFGIMALSAGVTDVSQGKQVSVGRSDHVDE